MFRLVVNHQSQWIIWLWLAAAVVVIEIRAEILVAVGVEPAVLELVAPVH